MTIIIYKELIESIAEDRWVNSGGGDSVTSRYPLFKAQLFFQKKSDTYFALCPYKILLHGVASY